MGLIHKRNKVDIIKIKAWIDVKVKEAGKLVEIILVVQKGKGYPVDWI